MTRKKIVIRNKKERVVLSDILPYEIPVIFSNRHFYEFLTENNIQLSAEKIMWGGNNPHLPDVIKLMFGFDSGTPLSNSQISVPDDHRKTVPFAYRVSHKENDFRELTLIHPQNQLALVNFYDKYKSAIIYYLS